MKNSRDMRVTSPSHWDVFVNGTDRYMALREYCTCPGCHTVWEHKETGDLQADWRWATAHYRGAYTCQQCGLTTEQIPNPSWRELWRGVTRRVVETIPSPNPFTEPDTGRDR